MLSVLPLLQVLPLLSLVLGSPPNPPVPLKSSTSPNPMVPPKSSTLPTPPVSVLAYAPTGEVLWVGRYREVQSVHPTTGELLGSRTVPDGRITALAVDALGQRLAVAVSQTGKLGAIHVFALTPTGQLSEKPLRSFPAHNDSIYGLAFSPNSKVLASASYDRLVKLWNSETGTLVHILKDHSDSVYGLAFHPQEGLLATVAADRAVKVWDTTSATRLYTLSDATDWLYCVAWHPHGKQLVAAGVDRSIRVWDADKNGGKLRHSVFAHEGPITHLAFSADGQTLYSVAEDRSVKAWHSDKMTERAVLSRQPETIQALALHPRGTSLALGRFDGALLLLDSTNGKPLPQAAKPLTAPQPQPQAPPPPAPKLELSAPLSVVRGQPTTLELTGTGLDTIREVTVSDATVAVQLEQVTPTQLTLRLHPAASTVPGPLTVHLRANGQTLLTTKVFIDRFPLRPTRSVKDSPRAGELVPLPATIAGTLNRVGEADYFRFRLQAGQPIGMQLWTTNIGSKLDAVLELHDEQGRLIRSSPTGLLGFVSPKEGIYSIGIRDREYRGGADFTYRLALGPIPIVERAFPLGVRAGATTTVQLEGVFLTVDGVGTLAANVTVPAETPLGTQMTVPLPKLPHGETPLGSASLVIGSSDDLRTQNGQAILDGIGSVSGRLQQPGSSERIGFSAKKGQRLVLEVHARRIGSPIDSVLEVLDAEGKPLPRAVLRCVARTFSTLRDHDSSKPGIRLEAWNELAVNDYLYAGNELMRIQQLPRNPDDDCRFVSEAGKRVGFLGTTPQHHAIAVPMYKVEIHPPGSTFPPNGMPVFTLFWRNDDGGPQFGSDSYLLFDPPSDGRYFVRISDATGRGGSEAVYRLSVRLPQPDFEIKVTPSAPGVWKGNGVPVTVTAIRRDGYTGPIEVKWAQVPAGFEIPNTFIEAEQESATVPLFAHPHAVSPKEGPPIKVIASAKIDGHLRIREATLGRPTALEPGDLVTSTNLSALTIRPGGEARLRVKVERRNGFKGRVPLDVLGLPHGVRVLNVGLNGILLTERDSEREIVLYAEPWVQPMEVPIVVLSRREGKNTMHTAAPVRLLVTR